MQMKFILPVLLFGCQLSVSAQTMRQVVETGLSRGKEQALFLAKELAGQNGKLPKTYEHGALKTSDSRWWTSGFFPGVLWYSYEAYPDNEILDYARMYTQRVEQEQFTTDNHDVGFMIYCSFGNGYRLTGDAGYKKVIHQAAYSLSTRFRPLNGCIQSWNMSDWNKNTGWQCPVIIDNMMNLELLTFSSKSVPDHVLMDQAVSHADHTVLNQFRPDYSSFHVVSYDTIRGNAHLKGTHQGFAHQSAWARGQAWGLYGYVMMYRETGHERYLAQAEKIAGFIMNHPRLPEDKIPYWDFDCTDIPQTPRDASAAAVMASAFLELSVLTKKTDSSDAYKQIAEVQLRNLTSDAYLAEKHENGGFVLKHSVGHFKAGSEVDTPLTYADYYYMEALLRYKKYYLSQTACH